MENHRKEGAMLAFCTNPFQVPISNSTSRFGDTQWMRRRSGVISQATNERLLVAMSHRLPLFRKIIVAFQDSYISPSHILEPRRLASSSLHPHSPDKKQKTSIRAWLPSSLLLLPLLSRPTSKIEPTSLAPLTNPSTPPPPQPSQPLFGESVNNNLAAQASSPSRSLLTIPPFDFPSFTTDHQQTWLSQPPSSAASAQSHQHNFDTDFELFAIHPEHRLQANSSLRPATQNTRPSSTFPQEQPHRQFAQAQLTQLSTIGYNQSSTNQRSFSSPTLHQHPSYSQHLLQLRQKPPVPLFSDTTVNRQGPRRRLQSDSSALPGPIMAFDNLYLPGGDDIFASQEDVMTDHDTSFPTSNFTTINAPSATQDPATISPQELFNSFTTPDSGYLESPMMGSSAYATTPLEDGGFMDDTLDYTSMNMPLFPQDGSDPFMETSMQRVHSQSLSQSASASPMVRQRSGPSPGSRPGTAHARKPSLAAGVGKGSTPKSRKPLPEIVIKEDDAKEIAKRKKNTAAARKSRENRANRMEALEAEVARLRGIVLNFGVDPDEGVDSPE